MLDALKNLGGLGNLGELMRSAKQMQEKMAGVQEELARKTVVADAGGGMVTATVNGKMELIKLRIDKTKVDPNDTELIEDLTVAAVRAAQGKAAEMMREEMARMAGGMGLPPGLLP